MARWVLAAVFVLAAGSCATIGDFASDDPGLDERPGRFEGRFIAVSDADMTATAYADGVLEPVGDADAATLFVNGAPAGAAFASNSVISWPQIVDVSPSGLVYVVESKAPAPEGVKRYDDVYTEFPEGNAMTVLRASASGLETVSVTQDVGLNLQSIEIARNGAFAVVGSEEDGAELVVLALDADGRIAERRAIDLDPSYKEDDLEKRVRAIHLSPDGAMIAVNVANRRVQFYELELDASGVPSGARRFGAPSDDVGRRLSVGKWTQDGRHFVITDVNWPEATVGMLVQGPGKLVSLAPPANQNGTPLVVSEARVGRSPEGFSFSLDGRYAASVNMERTYLPAIPPLAIWQGRRRYSVSLLTVSDAGALSEISRVYKAGILPEDVIFDETGENLAVAVFHRRKGADRERGFIDFFSIENDALKSQGVTQAVARGAHDLVLLP
ncbi:MAG: hypothetical protein AAFW81_08675 [Pseudomonadota bacterium]